MSILPLKWLPLALVAAGLWLVSAGANAQQNTTVLGPSNQDLYAGANALLAGDAEEGVRLTLAGLKHEGRGRDRLTGISNLCAGYIMLEQLNTALTYCDQVIEENENHWRAYSNRALAYVMLERYEEAEQDLQKAEAIAANARTVRIVRSMLLDATDPVAPQVVIDDRRQAEKEDDK